MTTLPTIEISFFGAKIKATGNVGNRRLPARGRPSADGHLIK
jgi:hypothetical protein